MLAELRLEREQIEEAILTLERLARGRAATLSEEGQADTPTSNGNGDGRRRGRPPGSKTKQTATAEA